MPKVAFEMRNVGVGTVYGRLFASVCGVVSLTGCGDGASVEDPDSSATIEQPVQRTYADSDYFSVVDRAALTTAQRRVFDAQGAVRVRLPDGTYGSCGATFVSPHFAITAAHCVDNYRAELDQFKVEQIRLTSYSRSAVLQASIVDGDSWPNWSPHYVLGSGDGYDVRSFTCTVRRNCSSDYGPRHDCPTNQAFPDWEADMALIECSTRSSGGAWVTAVGNGASPHDGKGVEIWWFHELLSMPTEPITSAHQPSVDRWEHYGLFGPHNQNYHYTRKHQLLPLLSSTWPSGTRYTITGTSDDDIMIDTPVCHGTSGSGAFVAGTDQYLGPIVSATGTIAVAGGQYAGNDDPGRLCAAMNRERPGSGITYIPGPHYAALMQDTSEVAADRLSIYP